MKTQITIMHESLLTPAQTKHWHNRRRNLLASGNIGNIEFIDTRGHSLKQIRDLFPETKGKVVLRGAVAGKSLKVFTA